MDALAVIGGILTLLTLFTSVPSLSERRRMLRGEFEYLRARIDDVEEIQRVYSPFRVQRGKKRKRDIDLSVWVADGRKLLKVAEHLLTQLDQRRSFVWSVDELVNSLVIHERKGEIFYRPTFSDRGGPHRGSCIPVKDLVGRATLSTLAELELSLQDTKVGRVAIHGREGIGKTFMMKHLHNKVLKWVERFGYVFWVSFPDEVSIKRVQDAIAAVVKCDFSSVHDLNLRARELSKKLGDLGNYVIFLDGVPKADFSLDQIGIPVPEEGSASKLVFTTTSSTFGCRMLDGFETVELEHLSENEAFQLFMREAKIDMTSNTLLDNIPRLLIGKCHGVPHMIVDIASNMCGIDDLREWKNAQFELAIVEKRRKQDISGDLYLWKGKHKILHSYKTGQASKGFFFR